MTQDSTYPARRDSSADFGKVKREVRDPVWDRPVFRAPLLPSPRIAFELLPQPFSHRLVAGR